jgi:hypothetical protein
MSLTEKLLSIPESEMEKYRDEEHHAHNLELGEERYEDKDFTDVRIVESAGEARTVDKVPINHMREISGQVERERLSPAPTIDGGEERENGATIDSPQSGSSPLSSILLIDFELYETEGCEIPEIKGFPTGYLEADGDALTALNIGRPNVADAVFDGKVELRDGKLYVYAIGKKSDYEVEA